MMAITFRLIRNLGWNRILLILLIIWLVVLFLMAFPAVIVSPPGMNGDKLITDKLTKALTDLEDLRKQNQELREIYKNLIKEFPKEKQKQAIENAQQRLTGAVHKIDHLTDENNNIQSKGEPNAEYEILRRKIYNNIKEFWNFMKHNVLVLEKLQKSKQRENSADKIVPNLLHIGEEHKRSLLNDMDRLAVVDGFAKWREQEAEDLSQLVQDYFYKLQNPVDCEKSRRLVCNLNKGCGYGCQLHHLAYCFIMAIGTQRTLILKSRSWRYLKSGWEQVFLPVSETCTDSGSNPVKWPGTFDDLIVELPIIDLLSKRPSYLPPAIPIDLSSRLTRLHGDPIVWWIGQILKYLLKPQPRTRDFLDKRIQEFGFKTPIVGIHIRRTDKVGTEASFHSVDEYMVAVEEYYNALEWTKPVDKRRVFVASDHAYAINEIRKKYTNYEVIGDVNTAKTADVTTRYSNISLYGIISDIHMLSLSDYLVCTFSSQVCRIAYEIMQNLNVDASSRFRSLDDIYYFGGQNAHNVKAVLPHEPQKSDELSLIPGDVIGIAGNHWNGHSKGTNLRTNQMGLYPSFKTINIIEVANFSIIT